MTSVATQPHAAGVLTATSKVTFPIYDGVATDFADKPYGVFYDLSGGAFDGPVGDPDADVEFPYQITVVGDTAEQVRAGADALRRVLASPITVTGRSVSRNAPDGGPGQLQRDDTSGVPVFTLTPRWRLFTTPA